MVTSGTQLTQPLTTLLKIKPADDMAQAELKASRERAQETENDVALKVHLLYYKVLIAQVHRTAMEARIKASQDLQSERVEQVKYGSTLEEQLIESRAQLLEAKQELLTTDLQLSDLRLQLNDAMGLFRDKRIMCQSATYMRCVVRAFGTTSATHDIGRHVSAAGAGETSTSTTVEVAEFTAQVFWGRPFIDSHGQSMLRVGRLSPATR